MPVFLGITLSSFVHAQNLAQQPCYSSRGGYCLKLIAPKNYQSSSYNSTNLRSAAVGTIPGLEFLPNTAQGNLGNLLASLYYLLLSVVGISALVMFVWGGIEYMLAGDKDPSKAKERMKNAVYGLVLALTSYIILYTINPDLVSRLDINLDPIAAPPAQTDGGPETATIAHGGICTEGWQCTDEADSCLISNATGCSVASDTGRCLNDTDPECKAK